MERVMQTICAHCYVRLPHRRQHTACILCSRCEQRWLAGKPVAARHRPPAWTATPAALSPPQGLIN